MNSMIVFGALVLLVWIVRPRRARTAAIAAAAVVLAIGFTRVGLGVHFVSDVVGGWLLGLSWLGLNVVVAQLVAARSRVERSR